MSQTRMGDARRAGILTVAAVLFLILSGCGSGKPGTSLDAQPDPQEFGLNISGDSLFDGATAATFDLSVIERDDGAEASVRVTGAAGLKALYVELEFNPELYSPVGVRASEAMGGPTELLTLEVLSDRGRVHYGQVLIHPQEREGFSGDGILATFSFERGPQVAERVVSVPPCTAASQTLLSKQGSLLEWYYYNVGDYNQDGLVYVSDLTPLGVHFEEQSTGFPAPFPIGSVQSAIDGNGDGYITIHDITPIGANYDCSALGGYHVYESMDVGDYPAEPADFGSPPTIAPLADLEFSECIGTAAAERLCFQTHVTSTLVDGYYWVRPTDGTDDGTPSNLTGGDSTTAVQFSVASTQATGNGTQADPYLISASSVIDFELFDPTTSSPIPSTDPEAVLIVDNPAAGEIAGFQFTADAAFTGQFAVFALYEDEPANPQKICFYVAQGAGVNNPPTAIAHAAPTAGAAPLYVVFYGGGSYDIDAGDSIASYEWDFGDGAGYQVLSDSEIYQYAAAGTYDASLRVTDTSSATDTAAIRITVSSANPNGPKAELGVNPNSGDMPLAVVFDASLSTAGANPIVSYAYDLLGNGAFVPGGPTYAQTYNQAGTYRVTMKVTDSAGLTDADWVDVIVTDPGGAPAPPQAALAAAPDKGQAPLGVVFDLTGSSTGAGIDYELDPNDGGPSYDPAAYPTQAHSYTADGTYIATLVVTDTGSGRRSLPAFRDIVVVTPTGSLTAVLDAAPDSGAAPLTVTLDATATSGGSGPYTYDFDYTNDGTWDVIGDTTGSTGHTYSTNGTYTARVRVTDSASATDEDTALVNVGGAGGALTADIVSNPTGGLAPLSVTLDATGTGGGTPPYTYEFDYTDDGVYDVTGNATGTTPYTYTTAGTITARVRVTDSASPTPNTDEDTTTINVSAGGALTANLVATPPCGGIPLAVTLDASGSSGGVPPYMYEFDFTDDGTYDVTGNTTGTAPNTYNSAADCTARVRVTDSSTPTPLTDEATALIEATVPLAPQLVPSPPCGLDPLSTTLDATATAGGKAPLSYDFDYTDDGTWDVTGNATGSVGGVVYTPVGPYTARVRVTDSCAVPQTAETTATIYSAAMLTPGLAAVPLTGVAPPPDQVTLDASATTGGTPPLEYRFDYESDGTWDTAWGPNVTVVPPPPYYAPGYHLATVEVRDSCTAAQQVAQSSTMFTISRNTSPTPPSGWHVQTVAANITGHWTSYTGLTLVQGIPMISYYDDDAVIPGKQGLYCVVANDAQGNTWAPPVQVMAGGLGVHSSIKEVVGEPAIAFFNQTALDLEYIRRVGGVWPGLSLVLDTPSCGSWCSMDYVYDDTAQLWLPAVSYIGEIGAWEFEMRWHGADVRYIPSVFPPDNLGTNWHVPQIIESSMPLGFPQFACTSLEYVDYVNNYPLLPPPYTWSPGVSYIALDWDPGPNGLKYSISIDRLGWNWSRPGFPMWIVQVPQFSVGAMTSLEKFPGMPWNPYAMGAPSVTPGNGWMPWISWCNATLPSPLAVEEATQDDGSVWVGATHQPDAGMPQVGDFSSLEMVGPVLGVSHNDYNIGELRYVDMAGTNPLTWNAPELPDPQPSPGADWKWGSYLIDNQGYPAISYYYWDGSGIDQVRYAVFY